MADNEYEDLDKLLERAAAMDLESEERWEIIRKIQRRADRPAFDAACAFAHSDSWAKRVLGLDVLGQIGYKQNRPFAEETLPILIQACEDDHPYVLGSAITALGHVRDPRGLAAVLRHSSHPSEDVRFNVAAALPSVCDDPPFAEAVTALISLSADPDPEIRDWATFGLGSQINTDTTSIRDALAARLTDPEEDTAGEALLGLALRHDPRTLPALLAMLADNPGNLIVEAAGELGSPEALPTLQRLKAEGWQDDDPRPSVLDDAIAACSR